MRKSSQSLATLLLVLLSTVACIGQSAFVEGEILVKLRSGTDAQRLSQIGEGFGARTLQRLAGTEMVRLALDGTMSTEEAVKRFAELPDVEYAQPNFYYRLQLAPNDPDFGSGMLYGLTTINAPAAWNYTTGSDDVIVANIDTGIRHTHEDLSPNIWTNPGELPLNGVDDDGNGYVDDYFGWDFRYNDSNPVDENGHGTHTAGTIGAVGNNALGVVGVNWNVRVMNIKIYSASGQDTTSAMLIEAYGYVLMMKNRGANIRITNNSYGGCQEACSHDQATKDAIDALGQAGILNVFSAGNSGVDTDYTPFFPASYNSPSVLAVGGSNSFDLPAFNFGAISVDLAAPGVAIRSTFSSTDASYATLSGTSMSAPHVSGAAALLAAWNPSLSPESIKASLMNSVDRLPAFSRLNKSRGRLNAENAIKNPTVCSFSNANGTLNVPRAGGNFFISVKARPNCDYMVVSNADWIKPLTATTLSGNQTITLWIDPSVASRRIGTLTIARQTFTVQQSGNLPSFSN